MYKKLLIIPILGSLLVGCNADNQEKVEKEEMKTSLTYPVTEEGNDVDTIFDRVIADPYRWLEDDMSDETAEWVKAQNKVTFDYLKEIPYREELKDRLSEIWNYEKVSAPRKRGDYVYYYKNDGLQNQYVVYRKDAEGNEEVFLDPNTFSEDGTTSLGQLSFTEDGTLAAYAISEGGSDWRKVIIMDAVKNEIIEDTLIDVKFSGLSWKNNDGFYYSSYDKPKGSELSAKTDQHKLYYHKLGTAQSDDQVVYGATAEQKRRYVGGSVSKDGKYLFISGSVSTSGNELSVLDLSNPNAKIKPLVTGFDQDAGVVTTKDETFYISTNLNAPNKRLVKTTFENPTTDNWVDVIPETENVLSISKGAGYFFAQYMVDAISEVKQYDYDGKMIRSIDLPGIGSAGGFGGKDEDEVLYYSFTNYITPGSVFEFNPEAGTSTDYWKPEIDFNPDNFVSEQVFYTSKDGTKVPMIITHKKGLKMDGKNPTILYGYGGFNVSLTPSFSVANVVWMENGGIYAVPNLRGGGEYGKEWHNAGTKMQKQNVFDDFISAAKYLKDKNYTSSDYLALRGGSNGGLLVGAVMTQEPELARVALPAVGVLDMIRYHTFTAGAGWAYDYGTAEDSQEMLDYLLGYSPVHNVKEGTSYPATMITTGDHDDRVVPAHSFKFAAELQKKNTGDSPMLIRIEVNAGHGAGTPVSKTIEQYADIYGFTFYNMGVTELGTTK
ncbi:prolyl oligopeptidase family serine peptidase [Brumimicrobium mesophilum]|uniref:prolyl oligopeptidase family serine peptidase n=1 Tax=Brumimicrobium mesophilum TaxID=392717 RepID=UPI0018FECF3A|nr:prolyl oligopeptidase family serine peptidase [Brumimicrobium mesophilum]